LPNHPWNALPSLNCRWRFALPEGRSDRDLNDLAAHDASTVIVFGGWRDRTIFGALWRRYTAGLPYAFWTDTPKPAGGMARWMLDRTFVRFAKRAVVTFATGAPAVQRYHEMGLPHDSVVNFPFVVDPASFAVAGARRPARVLRLLQVGRLIDSIKGQMVAFEALRRAIALSGCGSIRLAIAGVGPDDAALRAAADRMGIAAAVEFLGWVGYEAMARLFAESDALLMPSLWDPFPVTVIEALTAGLPVLGSDACGSVIERVRPDENGYIHRAGDSAALSEHILRLLDRSIRDRLASAAAAGACEWGVEKCVEAIRSGLARITYR